MLLPIELTPVIVIDGSVIVGFGADKIDKAIHVS
jgi:hypothetical protein